MSSSDFTSSTLLLTPEIHMSKERQKLKLRKPSYKRPSPVLSSPPMWLQAPFGSSLSHEESNLHTRFPLYRSTPVRMIQRSSVSITSRVRSYFLGPHQQEVADVSLENLNAWFSNFLKSVGKLRMANAWFSEVQGRIVYAEACVKQSLVTVHGDEVAYLDSALDQADQILKLVPINISLKRAHYQIFTLRAHAVRARVLAREKVTLEQGLKEYEYVLSESQSGITHPHLSDLVTEYERFLRSARWDRYVSRIYEKFRNQMNQILD